MSTSEFLNLFVVILFFVLSIKLIQIDLTIKRLPNVIVLPATIFMLTINLVNSWIQGDINSIVGRIVLPLLVTAGFFIISIFYPQGLGMGDIKVILFIGVTLIPFESSLYVISLCVSFVSGALYAIFVITRRRESKEFAFGPFLLIPAMAILAIATLS
jgi:leader peptidase (prepilin peptidase)/N-methyltransferase